MTMKVRYTVIDGEIIAEKRNGVRKQYVPDALGSTVALLDNTQTQTDTFTYWPYGEVASRTGTTPTPFQYVGTRGYRQDSASKTYVRARVLDTPKGRWVTQDPIGFVGGDWNLYRYVANMPERLIDITGTATYQCYVFMPSGCGWDVLQHSFISTSKCGAFGFYPDGVRQVGDDDNDDKHLRKGKDGRRIPGVGNPDEKVACNLLSSDPAYETAICKCMEESKRRHPTYRIFPTYVCTDWAVEMRRCACAITANFWSSFWC